MANDTVVIWLPRGARSCTVSLDQSRRALEFSTARADAAACPRTAACAGPAMADTRVRHRVNYQATPQNRGDRECLLKIQSIKRGNQ